MNKVRSTIRKAAPKAEEAISYQISEAGYRPQQRDILYNYVNRENTEDLDTRNSTPLKQLSVAFAD